jgi:hypothetical protein
MVLEVGRRIGKPIAEPPFKYERFPPHDLIFKHFKEHFEHQGHDDPRPGDIALMWGIDQGVPRHLAIVGLLYGSQITIIHSMQRFGGYTEFALDAFWRKRLVTMYQYPGTEPA